MRELGQKMMGRRIFVMDDGKRGLKVGDKGGGER